jgi:hypothetical protein
MLGCLSEKPLHLACSLAKLGTSSGFGLCPILFHKVKPFFSQTKVHLNSTTDLNLIWRGYWG